MLILSKKVFYSVENNLASIYNDTFTERNVKMLLVDLREICNQLKNQTDEDRPIFISTAFDSFLTICNSVLHTNLDRGIVEKNVREYMKKINDIFEKGKPHSIPDWSIEKIIHVDSLITGLLGMIALYISKFESNFSYDEILWIFQNRKEQISLTIMSLLQDLVITIGEESKYGLGILHLYVYQEKYRVYCRVFGSKVDRNAKKKHNTQEGGVIFNFPVVTSDIKDSNNLTINDDTIVTQLFETFRDSESILRLKEISRYSPDGLPLLRFKSSVNEIFNLLVSNTFRETDVKELMIDLREHAKRLLGIPDNTSNPKPESLKRFIGDFYEVCNALAHQNMKCGILKRNILEHVTALEKKYNGIVPIIPDNEPVKNIISSISIVSGLILVLDNYLTNYGFSVSTEIDSKILSNVNEISLCIISLLHEYVINLDEINENCFAIFHVHIHENKYHLYCRVFGSNMKHNATIKNKKEPVIIGFPVIITDAQDIDNIGIIESRSEQECIETYRDAEGKLRVRFVQKK